MAERIVSPGVFTQENDLSFIQPGIPQTAGAIVGPTVKGPVLKPTLVTSYNEFVQVFGETFESSSVSKQFFTSIAAKEYLKNSANLYVVRVMGDTFSEATSIFKFGTASTATGSGIPSTGSLVPFTGSFIIKTLSEGANLNSLTRGANAAELANGVLPSGSANNLRWEINGSDKDKGTFNLVIRRGNDTQRRKVILETFNGLTMDPNSADYIGLRVGTQTTVVRQDGSTYYTDVSGSYPNRSKFVRIDESSIQNIINYLDENGNVTTNTAALTASSFPANSSGSFENGADDYQHPMKFYDEITATNVQGLDPTTAADGKNAYEKAFGLLMNPDEFDINIIATPGLNQQSHATMLGTHVVNACENRGDCFAIIDPVRYAMSNADAVTEAGEVDSSYAAMYHPWILIPDTVTGGYAWVPPSTMMAGVYAFNDRVSHEWFAPAGLNRGGIETAVQPQYKLTNNQRDTLYEANVNPIASFPGEGLVAFGQKTLQKKASALDRVNVRRLLIDLKKFIGGVSRRLVFENNTAVTRNSFINQVEPYMSSVQEQQGLYAFRIQMDEENNTPDVIDRNELRGGIFIQPAKSAEFIIIDFNILPTGATFDD